jgi:hypothetical protein
MEGKFKSLEVRIASSLLLKMTNSNSAQLEQNISKLSSSVCLLSPSKKRGIIAKNSRSNE